MARVAVVAALLLCSGCQQPWEAQGGEAEITLQGALPWTDQLEITTELRVEGENLPDTQILCGVRADGGYDVAASTSYLDELKRLRVSVEIPHFYGTSGYGAEGDPSTAHAEVALREGGADGWFSEGDSFPCEGFVDVENIRGEFTCTGITGGTREQEVPDGPFDFDLSYTCGRAEDLTGQE